jgi:hypothetical protein
VSRRLLAAAAAATAVAVAGCGGGDDGAKPSTGLAWDGTPKVFRAKNLPDDRVVIARVRNAGHKTLHLVAKDLRVRDANGRTLTTTAAFSTAFAHGLFGMLQQPNPVPRDELLRLGKIAVIPAGASVPFYAAWRLKPGTKEPVRIDYGTGTLDVPAATATAAGR